MERRTLLSLLILFLLRPSIGAGPQNSDSTRPAIGTQPNPKSAIVNNLNVSYTPQAQDLIDAKNSGTSRGSIRSGGIPCANNSDSPFYVGGACAKAWGDGNLGMQINAAIAALPAIGGTIHVMPGAYTVPLGTIILSKPVRLVGDSRSSTVLMFTGSAGVAIVINYVSTGTGDYRDWSDGVEGLQLVGPGGLNGTDGNLGVGIQVADRKHISIGVRMDNTLVAGFAIGLNWGNALAWGGRIEHCTFINNTQDFMFNPETGNGTENISFDHTVFGNTTTGMNANSVQITGTAMPEIYFNECSFDGDQVTISTGSVHFINSHHENPAGNATIPYVSIKGGTVSMYGPRFAQVAKSGGVPASFVDISGGTVSISNWLATSAAEISTVFKVSGRTNVYLANPMGHPGVTTDVTNTSTGNVLTLPNAKAQIADSINGISVFATETKGVDVLRMKVNTGTPYTSSDNAIVLSPGFGSTAAVSGATGYDQAFSFSVTAGGSGIAANPTIAITFKDGSWTTPPQFQVARNDAATPSVTTAFATWSTTSTILTITFNGTPVTGQVYKFVVLGLGN